MAVAVRTRPAQLLTRVVLRRPGGVVNGPYWALFILTARNVLLWAENGQLQRAWLRGGRRLCELHFSISNSIAASICQALDYRGGQCPPGAHSRGRQRGAQPLWCSRCPCWVRLCSGSWEGAGGSRQQCSYKALTDMSPSAALCPRQHGTLTQPPPPSQARQWRRGDRCVTG